MPFCYSMNFRKEEDNNIMSLGNNSFHYKIGKLEGPGDHVIHNTESVFDHRVNL